MRSSHRCIRSIRTSRAPGIGSRCSSIQYWGGPTTYSDERGHPRLRMRHMPFTIAEAERDRWLVHMLHAVDVAAAALDVDDADRDDIVGQLRGYFIPSAEHMRNNTGLPITSPGFRQGRRTS